MVYNLKSKDLVTFEIMQERKRTCNNCEFFVSCSEKNKGTPNCNKIAKIYNTKENIKKCLEMEKEMLKNE